MRPRIRSPPPMPWPDGCGMRSMRSETAVRSRTAKPDRSTRSRIWESRSPSCSILTISGTCRGRTWPAAGAGGGMRWPNRQPHSLTPGMRHAQGVMAEFSRLIDWPNFASRNDVPGASQERPEELVAFGCSDEQTGDDLGSSWQWQSWVPTGTWRSGRCCKRASVEIMPSRTREPMPLTSWRHGTGTRSEQSVVESRAGGLALKLPPFRHDLAIAVHPVSRSPRS